MFFSVSLMGFVAVPNVIDKICDNLQTSYMTNIISDIPFVAFVKLLRLSHYEFVALSRLSHYDTCHIMMFVALCRQLWHL